MSSKSENRASNKISDFGRRLKVAFNRDSNQSIAEKLGVGKSALTAYMQGRIPAADKLIEIAKITGCNLNWLLTGEGRKNNLSYVERPQGIILQGSKGGIGTSVCAVLIAINLALRGYGVLLAEDALQTCSSLLFPERDWSDSYLTELSKTTDYYQNDYYVPTSHENLDFFVPKSTPQFNLPKDEIKLLDFDHSKMSKKYQFVIFDVQRMENPFYYPHKPYLENFYLEPILRSAKVIVPYEVMQSQLDNVRRTARYVSQQQLIYPAAEFSGIFLVEQDLTYKSHQRLYKKKFEILKEAFPEKIFNNKIDYHLQLREPLKNFQKIMFSPKTEIHANFSALVDELLEKIQ
jgi:cellulose biosynthesis protein BcsQ